MAIVVWTLLIAALTAVTCSLCGLFLVLKREALVAEGLAHAVLPGIVLAFVLLRDRSSPLLIVGAAATGLLMILVVQLIRRTGVVDGDASLGVVFPALFSLGILLANAELADTHFHADCIIDGNLALSSLDRLVIGGRDLGPKPFWAMLTMLTLVTAFLGFLFKEMKLMTFDSGLADTLGLRPQWIHIAWLALVSMTTVTAFETAGSVLVVALMIAPPAAAYLWTHDLRVMTLLAAVFAVISATSGFGLGWALDLAPNGPMASMAGLVFLVSLAVAPRRGLVARSVSHDRAQRALEGAMLEARLLGGGSRTVGEVREELGWDAKRFDRALKETAEARPVRWDRAAGTLALIPRDPPGDGDDS